jgi:hypothetical protein
MNAKFLEPRGRSASCIQSALVLTISLLLQLSVNAEIVELSITGYWSERDFKVIQKSDQSYSVAQPKFDGKVLGISPSAGEVTFTIVVNTDESVFFAKGTQNIERDGKAYTLEHDLYGYKEVSLADGTFSFGSATWRTEGILTGLEGPNDSRVALWTDTDITKEDPVRMSFRMFGNADGLKADLFVGGRSATKIGRQFLLWEYYAGEEIRSMKYVAKRKV